MSIDKIKKNGNTLFRIAIFRILISQKNLITPHLLPTRHQIRAAFIVVVNFICMLFII